MEINSAITVGFIVATHMFLFCIIGYYINMKLFKLDINALTIFMFFSKPLYSYQLKNGIKINFGYIPITSYLNYSSDQELSIPEADILMRERRKKGAAFQLMMLFLLTSTISVLSLVLGFNPVKIFLDFWINSYEFIKGNQTESDFLNFIHHQYEVYGKYFFIFFAVMSYFILITVVMIITSLWHWFYITLFVLLVISYFVFGLQYLKLPFTFYIDLFLTLTISGFIYFLLLRYFIK